MCLSLACGGCLSLCTCCCGGCAKVGVHQKNWPKVTYVINDVFMMLISFILMYTLRPLADKYPDHFTCNETAGGGANCFGVSSVLRMSFALFCYHIIILLTLIPRAQCSSLLHDGLWPIKFLIILALFILAFFIPHAFFLYFWNWLCRIGSAIFLVIQSYFLLDMAYKWNEQLIARDDSWAYGLLCGYSVFITAANVGGMIVIFVLYSACGFGKVMAIVLAIC